MLGEYADVSEEWFWWSLEHLVDCKSCVGAAVCVKVACLFVGSEDLPNMCKWGVSQVCGCRSSHGSRVGTRMRGESLRRAEPDTPA